MTLIPKYAQLAGDKDFEDYVFKPNHKGVDIETLANAYLYKGTIEAPAPEIPSDGLERGSGGPRTAPETGMSAEEAEALRISDPKGFRQALITGKIKF